MFKPTLTSKVSETIDVPEADAKVTIHYIKPGVMDNINQSAMQLMSKESDSGMKSEISFNMSAKDRAIVRECVDGWSGFTGDGGTPMKFSASNLEKMIIESTEFVSWVVEEHEKLTEKVEGEQEEAEKNS